MSFELAPDEIDKSIEQFKSDLLSQTTEMMVRSTVITGNCFIFTPHEYAELRSEIATQFSIHSSEVLVVGSAKLGFSIAPKKRYNHFHDGSDIDVAIVNSSLFDDFWNKAFSYDKSGVYWPQRSRFIGYLFHGWIRPDKLPPTLAHDWFEYFRVLTQTGKFGSYKITAGLYKNFDFLETYQCSCVEACRTK